MATDTKSSARVRMEVREKTADEIDMERLGTANTLNRRLNAKTLTLFMVLTGCTWAYVLNGASLGLDAAGTGGLITVYIGMVIMWSFLIISLAEMASLVPLSGGPYHWVATFASPSWRKLLSYIAGWLLTTAWLCGVAASNFINGQMIRMTIIIGEDDAVIQQWQTYCLVLAITLLCLVFNTLGMRVLPVLEFAGSVFYVVGLIASIVVYAVMAPKNDASAVFGTFIDGGGWGSTAFACLTCQVASLYFVLGTDGAAHMSEETKDASINVPRAMLWSYAIGVLTAFGMLILFCFCYTEAAQDAAKVTGYAFMGVNYVATGSVAGAKALTVVTIIPCLIAANNFTTASSRQLFAFARDGGVPFSSWVSHVSRSKYPRNAVLVVTGFTVLLTLVTLGSTVAFYAIVSLTLIALVATYLFAICVLIHRRLVGPPLPPSRFSLGRMGLPINIVGALYGIFLLIFSAMPPTPGYDPTTFNWAPVIFLGIMAFAIGVYVLGMRKSFKGPTLKDSDNE